MARIYVSSTYRDLVDFRGAVYRTLRRMRHDAIAMEDYAASDERPVDRCLADVRACDVYVGIFAWRTGYEPEPGSSITELELREARANDVPCLIFLVAEGADWPAEEIDPDRSRIEALRRGLERDHTVEYFSTPDELATDVGVSVSNLCVERGLDRDDTADPDRVGFYRDCLARFTRELATQIRIYSISSGVLVLLGSAIVVVGFVATEGLETVLGLGGVMVSATTVFPVATLLSTRRKRALLRGYETELGKETPARDALLAIKRFLELQLAEGHS